jgi:CHAT domain-containing protein
MSGKASWLFIVAPVLLSFQQPDQVINPKPFLQEYQKANTLYSDNNANDSVYSTSLRLFEHLIRRLEQTNAFPGSDTLLFQSYLKKGVLLESLHKDYRGSVFFYRRAISISRNNSNIREQASFTALGYLGACYYNLNNFDSSIYFLEQAQAMIRRTPHLADKEFVFNTLGVLYYDNGNYLQSKNYFSQALDIIASKIPFDTASTVSIETNMATALYHMDQFDDAITLYKKILRFGIYTDFVYLNMGRAMAALGRYEEALNCYNKVNAGSIPGIYNEIASVQISLNQFELARKNLKKFHDKNLAKSQNRLDLGVNLVYLSELDRHTGNFAEALNYLQQAICIFSGHFNDLDKKKNPVTFTGTLTYDWLFRALSKKAACLDSLYQTEKKLDDLYMARDAHHSILSLLSYVEKSYATDDAKIFIKKKTSEAYHNAFNVCLRIYAATGDVHLLEDAFLVSEKNKASIISASLNERKISLPGHEQWSEEERNIKYNIARLNVRIQQSTDSKSQEELQKEIGNYEIRLQELEKTMEENDQYHRLKYADDPPAIVELQRRLNPDQGLLSFYAAPGTLYLFIITKNSFDYLKIDSLTILEKNIHSWLEAIHSTEKGRKFSSGKLGESISLKLLKPVMEKIGVKNEWIIIPDGILSFLPFESLPWRNSWLIESKAISYLYSTRFLPNESTVFSSVRQSPVLAFAPFATDPGRDTILNRLVYSGEEIRNLQGQIYLDKDATKEEFLKQINHFPIVHLATHARSDLNNTGDSWVAFYPNNSGEAQNKLYLEELYGLNMENTKLMIISACETGQGEFVSNEGVISIARAFTYAGCSSVVNSLWKADDKATAEILKQFHYYLKKGLSKSRALQQAKLDYIHGNSLRRSPEYWSHLILIGNTAPVSAASRTWMIAMAGVGMLLAGLLLMTLKREKKVDAFMDSGS